MRWRPGNSVCVLGTDGRFKRCSRLGRAGQGSLQVRNAIPDHSGYLWRAAAFRCDHGILNSRKFDFRPVWQRRQFTIFAEPRRPVDPVGFRYQGRVSAAAQLVTGRLSGSFRYRHRFPQCFHDQTGDLCTGSWFRGNAGTDLHWLRDDAVPDRVCRHRE